MLESRDLKVCAPQIAAQWHPTKNGTLTPGDVTPGSRRYVWWQCEQGHTWMASPRVRMYGTGCPICAKQRSEAEGTLDTRFPMLAKEWHPTRNGARKVSDVSPSSTKTVWWQCENGHEWREPVKNRTEKGDGCPVCSGKQLLRGYNDLKTVSPAVAAEWAEENGSMTPQDVTAASKRRVFWECPKGHVWKASVADRVQGIRTCPYCSSRFLPKGYNDLRTVAPEIAAQWHPTKNGALGPEDVKATSRKNAWWICKAGHVWQASVKSRTEQNDPGCPICAAARQNVGADDLGSPKTTPAARRNTGNDSSNANCIQKNKMDGGKL